MRCNRESESNGLREGKGRGERVGERQDTNTYSRRLARTVHDPRALPGLVFPLQATPSSSGAS